MGELRYAVGVAGVAPSLRHESAERTVSHGYPQQGQTPMCRTSPSFLLLYDGLLQQQSWVMYHITTESPKSTPGE